MRKIMNYYLKRFIESFTSENVIALFSRYKNAAKEITESWGMLEAAKKLDVNLSECKVVAVGDGASPRTGAVFAYYSGADVISLDPNANIGHWEEHCEKQTLMGYPPQRIVFLKNKIEDIEINCLEKTVIVVWPHSHADMNNTHIGNYSRRIDIAMPCCVAIPNNWKEKPHISYTDYNVLSEKRDIHIWDWRE
jgi:hypothetical protein